MSETVLNPLDVLLDVDTGCDDAHALLLAVRSSALNVLGVTCVSGNVSLDAVTAATMQVLDAAGAPPDLPVARGFGAPLVEPEKHCMQVIDMHVARL